MAYSSHKLFLLLLAIFVSHSSVLISSNASTTYQYSDVTSLRSFCRTTPHSGTCFNSLKISSSINSNTSPTINTYLLQSLQVAISETKNLSNLFHNVGHKNIKEKQRGTIQDCRELHQSTLASLEKSLTMLNSSSNYKNIVDARAYLSAALTNKNTCLEGLDSASGTMKPVLVNSEINTYKHVSNSLAILSKPEIGPLEDQNHMPSIGAPKWLPSRDNGHSECPHWEEYEPNEVLVVAKDGTGNFSTIIEAINFAPNNSKVRTVIYVKEGSYEENVEIPMYKTKLVMLGDGSDVTVITGKRSAGDDWTTYRSATLAVLGEGFLACDIAFENSAGPEKYQAVALRVNADLTAFYRCAIYGYQDSLYVHSFRQFYRECDIYGTIDFIFGNAAVVFQDCKIVSKTPLPGQSTVITAQGRESPDQETGISIQHCKIIATPDLCVNYLFGVKSYLGRPWKVYSRTVYLESYIDYFIDPKGWTKMSNNNDQGLDTLYYGEYENYGPGSSTYDRVDWLGYHIMNDSEAYNFTVSKFINEDHWLESTSFPYDDEI